MVVLPPRSGSAHTIDPPASGSYDQAMRAVGTSYAPSCGRSSCRVCCSPLSSASCSRSSIAFAAGAHRTETLPARVDAAVGGGFDYLITQQESGTATVDRHEWRRSQGSKVPTPTRSCSVAWRRPAPRTVSRRQSTPSCLPAASRRSASTSSAVAPLDQSVDDEFVATPSFVRRHRSRSSAIASISTRISQEQRRRERLQRGRREAHAHGDAGRRSSRARRLVDDPQAYALFPKRLIDRPDVGIALTMIPVRVRAGRRRSDPEKLSWRHLPDVGAAQRRIGPAHHCRHAARDPHPGAWHVAAGARRRHRRPGHADPGDDSSDARCRRPSASR